MFGLMTVLLFYFKHTPTFYINRAKNVAAKLPCASFQQMSKSLSYIEMKYKLNENKCLIVLTFRKITFVRTLTGHFELQEIVSDNYTCLIMTPSYVFCQ